MNEASVPEWRDDWALFLDVDGTLLELAATPTAVRVPEMTTRVLAGLATRFAGAVALVSGRQIADLDRMFAPVHLPTAGVHGAERRDAGGNVRWRVHDSSLDPARRLLAKWRLSHAGTLLEDKGAALALHYRTMPTLEAAARRVVDEAAAAVGPAFHVQDGKMVLEIKAVSTGKGQAIAEFMQEDPFRGRTPVFIGDDQTDEEGFVVVDRLGGHSIAVGMDRSTRARFRLRDEHEVLRWLSRGAEMEPEQWATSISR
jgi:trehalose 6-phosphate phosphatase